MNILVTYISHTKNWFLLLLFSCISLAGFAHHDVKIQGKVVSGEEAIPFAKVMVEGTQFGALTDETGAFRFTMEDIEWGSYSLVVQLQGYKTLRRKINIDQEEIELKLELSEDALHLDEVIISATRGEMSRRDAPVVVNVIDDRLFEATQSVSLSEGLSYQPGLRLETNCQNCGFTQVRINGLQGPYSQILVDSRPVFSALNGVYGLDQIPASMIERVEVVRGSGSALFGANAIAGTINIITKDPIDNTWQVSNNLALIGGSTLDEALSVNASAVSQDLKAGLSVFGIYRNRGWFDANGDGFSEITQLRNNSFGLKTFYKPKPGQRLSLEAHTLNEFRRGGNLFELPAHQTDITEQLAHDVFGGQLAWEQYSKDLSRKFSTYVSGQYTWRDSYYGGGGNSSDPAEQLAATQYYGKTTDLSLVGGALYAHQFNSFLGRQASLTVGSELNMNKVDDRMPGYGRQIDQQVLNLGTYGQFEFKPLSFLKLLGGLRFDHVGLDGSYRFANGEPAVNDRNFNVLNPRLNALVTLPKQVQLRFSYATGFRAPQAFDEDLHIETLGGRAQFIRLNSNLRAERSSSFTASVDWSKDIGRKMSIYVLLDGFHTRLSAPFINEFTGDTLSGSGAYIMEKRNGSGASVSGVNAEVRMAWGNKFDLQTGLTLQSSRYETPEVVMQDFGPDGALVNEVTTQKLLRTPDLYGYFATNYQLSKPFLISFSGVYTGPMDVPNERLILIKRSASFMELNLKLAYNFELAKELRLQLSGGVQNMFNSYQQDLESGPLRDAGYVYGPSRPRTMFIGLKLGSF